MSRLVTARGAHIATASILPILVLLAPIMADARRRARARAR
ncbi:hypothetical protein OR37_00803, partial [Caulobacter vibrioides OR37]